MNLDEQPRVIITHEFADDLSGWVTIQLRLSALQREADVYLAEHPRIQAFIQGMDERDIHQIIEAGFAVA